MNGGNGMCTGLCSGWGPIVVCLSVVLYLRLVCLPLAPLVAFADWPSPPHNTQLHHATTTTSRLPSLISIDQPPLSSPSSSPSLPSSKTPKIISSLLRHRPVFENTACRSGRLRLQDTNKRQQITIYAERRRSPVRGVTWVTARLNTTDLPDRQRE